MAASFVLAMIVLSAQGHAANASSTLPRQLNGVVDATDPGWRLVVATRTNVGRIHRWERNGETLVFQLIECETPQAAEAQLRGMLLTVSLGPRENFVARDSAVIVGSGKSSTVYMQIGRRVLPIGAPSEDLTKRLALKAGLDLRESPQQ